MPVPVRLEGDLSDLSVFRPAGGDALGPAWLAAKLKEEGIEVPALLKKLGDGTFYRIENGKRQYFGTDGKYHDVKRPDGVLLLSDIKLSSKPVLKNGSAKVWDVGDVC